MRIKKILSIFSSFFPLSLLISCSTQLNTTTDLKQIQKEQKKPTLQQQKEATWSLFLENSVIQNILKLAYPNEDARNSYIEFEKQIDSQKQVQRLKNDFFYYSYIRTETAAYNEESKPLFILNQETIFLKQ